MNKTNQVFFIQLPLSSLYPSGFLWYPSSLQLSQLSFRDLCCSWTEQTALLSLQMPRSQPMLQDCSMQIGHLHRQDPVTAIARDTRQFVQPQQTQVGLLGEDKERVATNKNNTNTPSISSKFYSQMSDSLMSTNTLDVCVQSALIQCKYNCVGLLTLWDFSAGI